MKMKNGKWKEKEEVGSGEWTVQSVPEGPDLVIPRHCDKVSLRVGGRKIKPPAHTIHNIFEAREQRQEVGACSFVFHSFIHPPHKPEFLTSHHIMVWDLQKKKQQLRNSLGQTH